MLAGLVVPASAAAQERTVETATAGDVTAELSYVKRQRGSGQFRFEEFRDFRVRVGRAAARSSTTSRSGSRVEQFCTPAESALTRKHVGLRDLNGDGEPEAIVDLFTGGSSCCVFVYAYGFDPAANVYRRARLDTGGGFVVRDYGGDGVLELVGDDFRFRGLFTCGACGSRPIRIWHYGLRRFEVVTPSFPAQIRTHARRMKRIYERVRHRKDAPVFVKGALTPVRGRPLPARSLRRGLPAGASRDPARRARTPLGLRRLATRRRLPAARSSASCAAPAICADALDVVAEAVLDAAHLVLERLAGRSRRSSSLSTV